MRQLFTVYKGLGFLAGGRMKKSFNFKCLIAALVAVSFYISATSVIAHASEVKWSNISTTYQLSKQMPNNRVLASFEVFAAGDTYAMALQRATKINNNFLSFLKKIFNPKNIKTHSSYNQSDKASIAISIDSSRINNISKVLQYIASRHFAYKTGIKPDSIKFTVSEQRKQAMQSELLRIAIIQAKQKLKMINSLLGGGYTIRSLTVRYQSNRIYPRYIRMDKTLLGVSASSRQQSPIYIASGSNIS